MRRLHSSDEMNNTFTADNESALRDNSAFNYSMMSRIRGARIVLRSALISVSLSLVISSCAAAQLAAIQAFGNEAITARLHRSGSHLYLDSIQARGQSKAVHLHEIFVLGLEGQREIRASELISSSPVATPLEPDPAASRAAARLPGRQICAELRDPAGSFNVHWCMIARGNAPYLRQEISIQAGGQPLALRDVQLLRFRDQDARVVGLVAGSPIVSGNYYLGFENPLSYSSVQNGEAVAGLKRTLSLAAGQSITYSSVVGAARPGQMRRDFLAYLELERAHPYRTFLHYNTWYDLGRGERFGAAQVEDRIDAFGEELVRKRGVTIDSFLLDDGWDDTHTMWQMNAGFPNGLAPLSAAAREYGFGLGVWFSPWGGYQEEKEQRIAYGQSHGYETVKGGYALSGPRYYEKFEEACLKFLQEGVNQFKVDGTGNASQVFPGSVFDSDFSAAIHLIDRLRQQNPTVFIDVTTGTWPSPFWLRYADTICRLGEDHSFAGEGTWRQKWITYRDEQTYHNIVRAGPLFPLSSLMLHGIIYASKADKLATDPGHDFADEVHSYFGGGTDLQELYITPSLLTSADWDVLAEGARWSRANAATLRDTHWIGGDPGKGEPYGWASWSAEKGILVLRNPASKPQQIPIDVGQAFELPEDGAAKYIAHSPWTADASRASIALEAGRPYIFLLKPFEVVTLEARPER